MLYIGADHQGRLVKNDLLAFLKRQGIIFEEIGKENYSSEDDYPDFATAVSLKVLEDTENKGILLCGSGQGMAIAANRFRGIRAGLCWNLEETTLARSDDDINILCLPRSLFNEKKEGSEEENSNWQSVIKAFLETDFKDAPKYSRRKEKLDRLP
ncbi:MAG: RpiB/LacA/LacB family sugar-phosphate isomerase [Candidatus Nomurabacteria bacterium]|nr:MAG: RpiB/LacA/LacB family sugar-phosphate isomerase [Candidatus Nomurabacteria bacterium]HRV76034.1 RpiB/LacA/LacB family sugar-phosphate isomerase [Candidatus Saccharimonadales bacterium]